MHTATMENTETGLVPIQQAENDIQVVTMWLRVAASHHTRRCYRSDVSSFLADMNRPLRRITVGMLQEWADTVITTSKSRATACRKLASVRSLFRFAHDIGYLTLNPALAVRVPHVRPAVRRRIPTRLEVARLVEFANAHSDEASLLVRTLYVTGGRVSEILGLRGGDITVRDQDGILTLWGKGNKLRNVAVPRELAMELLERAPGATQRAFPKCQLTYRQLWRRITREAGMTWLVPHALRHAHATHALESGCPLHVLRDTLGHSSIAITSRYVHATPGESSAKYIGANKEAGQ